MKKSNTKKSVRKSTKKSSSFTRSIKKITIKQWLGIAILTIFVGVGTWFAYSQQQVAANSSNKLQVMASFYPVYDLAKHVGGEAVEVRNITPAGAEAHDFEPSPKTITEIHKADLFIYHDEVMEPWVDKFIKEYQGASVRAIEGIKTHAVDDHDEAESGEEEHEHAYDPHIWTDPVLASKMVDNIARGFAIADPKNKAVYETNAAQLKEDLAVLDKKFTQGLANCSQRTIVTSHAAFHYFADRYNLTILPISGLTPTQEPSAGKLAELSRLVSEKGISTIFFESQTNPHLADTLARETGAKTAILDPIEGINQAKTGETYVSIQEKNLVGLKAALACN